MKNLMVIIENWLLVLLTVPVCSLFPGATGLSEENDIDTGWSSTVNLSVGIILSVFVVVTVTIFLVFMCGGCTDMEVGTTAHPACGPTKSSDFHSVMTDNLDMNTKVMSASHVVPGERIPLAGYNQTELPYSLNPENQVMLDRFSGTANEPHSPTAAFSYGYGTALAQQGIPHRTGSPRPLLQSPVSGYTATATVHGPGPHAHQPVPGTDSEPPPPAYNESMRHQQQPLSYR